MTIPKILHFTWKSQTLPPRLQDLFDKWKALHPAWEVRLHTHEDMRDFVATRAPEFLAPFDGYPRQIQRIDAFRYHLLFHVGGVYADLDIEPIQPIDAMVASTECFVAVEPEQHVRERANRSLGVPFVLCNAFMGSRPGHPFWTHVVAHLARGNSKDVLFTAGPWMLTAAALIADDADRPAVVSPAYWSPLCADGSQDAPTAAFHERLARQFVVLGAGETAHCSHLWLKTWAGGAIDYEQLWYNAHNRLKWTWRRRRRTDLVALSENLARPALDYDQQILRPLKDSDLPRVEISTPLKNATRFLPRYAELIEALDYPGDRISVGLLVSDSDDGTLEAAQQLAERWRGKFSGVTVQSEDFGYRLDSRKRGQPRHQMRRRSILARCRNALACLAVGRADYSLLVDVDLLDVPPEALRAALSARRPVVAANCVNEVGEVFDANAFLLTIGLSFRVLYKFGARKGLLQPPWGFERWYLTDLTCFNIVPLDCVGGTFLLVDNAVFRAGVVFPETPYKFHIETEGFAIMARDHGFESSGLPNLKVVHPAVHD